MSRSNYANSGQQFDNGCYVKQSGDQWNGETPQTVTFPVAGVHRQNNEEGRYVAPHLRSNNQKSVPPALGDGSWGGAQQQVWTRTGVQQQYDVPSMRKAQSFAGVHVEYQGGWTGPSQQQQHHHQQQQQQQQQYDYRPRGTVVARRGRAGFGPSQNEMGWCGATSQQNAGNLQPLGGVGGMYGGGGGGGRGGRGMGPVQMQKR